MVEPNIYRAQRSTISQPFGAPIDLTQVNSAGASSTPSVSSDGLMLFFESLRISGEGSHLYGSTRTSRVGEFGAPSEVGNVNSAKVTDSDGHHGIVDTKFVKACGTTKLKIGDPILLTRGNMDGYVLASQQYASTVLDRVKARYAPEMGTSLQSCVLSPSRADFGADGGGDRAGRPSPTSWSPSSRANWWAPARTAIRAVPSASDARDGGCRS
jgi:hypothetical protein